MKLRLQFFGGSGASGDLGGSSNKHEDYEHEPITRQMHNEADPTLKKGLEEFMSSVEDANDSDFNGLGDTIGGFYIADMRNKASLTMGFYELESGGLNINRRFLDDRTDARYDATVASGYHPSRGDKSGIFAIMIHETGHAVSDKIAHSRGMGLDAYCRDVMVRASRETRHKTMNDMAGSVSRYATESYAECIAEAFADVRCNGSKASITSQAIYKRLANDYKKLKKK